MNSSMEKLFEDIEAIKKDIKAIKEYLEKTLMAMPGEKHLYIGDWLYFDMVPTKRVGGKFIWIYRFDIPDELKPLKPWERVKHEKFKEFYKKAWNQEIMQREDIFEFTPDYIVFSLTEIPMILDYEK